jgi:hypothetical protein
MPPPVAKEVKRLDEVSEGGSNPAVAPGPRIRGEPAKQAEGVPQTEPFVVAFVLTQPAEQFLSATLSLPLARLQGSLEEILQLAARQPSLLQSLGRLVQEVQPITPVWPQGARAVALRVVILFADGRQLLAGRSGEKVEVHVSRCPVIRLCSVCTAAPLGAAEQFLSQVEQQVKGVASRPKSNAAGDGQAAVGQSPVSGPTH